MTRSYGPAKRPKVSAEALASQHGPNAVSALSGVLRALSACDNWRDRVQLFNDETGRRFRNLTGRARNYAANQAMCRGEEHGREFRGDWEDSQRAKAPTVAAGKAWVARHHVTLALAWASWGECSDQEWRAECRRVRQQAIRELEEALS